MSRSEDGTHGGLTRRGFLGAAAGTLSAGVIAGAARGDAAPAAIGSSTGGREAMGDLARRIAATAGRLTGAGIPAFTEEFVIADVTLDPGRRFTNYSGDLSGRYIEALSVLPPAGRSPADLARLVGRLLRAQQPDGRFGRSDLRFTPAEIGTDHMPLLWGNGRLLVGLMAYSQATGDPHALASARKLGDFLLGVQSATGSREVVERVELAGAAGFICFTQLNEGLMLLWQATRDERCLVAARETMRLLRPRGVQHSHGYLTTLRGALMLYDATRDAAIRDEVERAFGDLTASADYLVDGGTHEFFGWHDPANTQALGSLRKGLDDFGRNEGCSLGDLVRLALHLHRATGKVTYLEAAERCYLNAFSHNQFASGDFGHRSYFERGFRPVPNLARSWWCCTMHGYRCFADVLDAAVAVDGDGIRVDLFEDLRVGGAVALRTAATAFGVTVTFDRPFEGTLAVRVPGWATRARLLRNGSPLAASPDAGYLRLAGRFTADETVELAVTPRVWVRSQANREVAHDAVGPEPLDGALLAGPYLMAVAEEDAPDFFGEPWTGGEGGQSHGNVIRLDPSLAERLGTGRWPRLTTTYDHGGFRGRHPVVLRALGARPAGDQQIHAFWLPYARG